MLSWRANGLLVRAEIEVALAQNEGRDDPPRQTLERPQELEGVDEPLMTEESSSLQSWEPCAHSLGHCAQRYPKGKSPATDGWS